MFRGIQGLYGFFVVCRPRDDAPRRVGNPSRSPWAVFPLVADQLGLSLDGPPESPSVALRSLSQSAGEFVRWNPHWHGRFPEGGFDHYGRFLHLPPMDLFRMSGCFRQRVVAVFLQRKLLRRQSARRNRRDHGGGPAAPIAVFAPGKCQALAIILTLVSPPFPLLPQNFNETSNSRDVRRTSTTGTTSTTCPASFALSTAPKTSMNSQTRHTRYTMNPPK